MRAARPAERSTSRSTPGEYTSWEPYQRAAAAPELPRRPWKLSCATTRVSDRSLAIY